MRPKGVSSKKEKCAGVATNVYSSKTLEKTIRGLQILKRRVRELFTCGEGVSDAILPRKGLVTRAMSKRLQEDWARAVEEGPRVLMNLRVDF